MDGDVKMMLMSDDQIEELLNDIKKRDAEIAHLKERLKLIDGLMKKIQEKDAEIKEQAEKLEYCDERIKFWRKRADKRNTENIHLRCNIEDNDMVIELREKEIKRLEGVCVWWRDQMVKIEKERDKLKEALESGKCLII